MCRWNFMGLVQHPKVRELDYYCRMDTDSRMTTKVRLTRSPTPSAIISPCAARHLATGGADLRSRPSQCLASAVPLDPACTHP